VSAEAVQAGAVASGAHVFADPRIDRHAAAIAAVIDPAFLAEAGWDPTRKVLSFDPEHPLLGRPVCRAAGCSTSAQAASRICFSCCRRLAERGLGEDEIASLPPRARQRTGRGPDTCVVDGCRREWESASSGCAALTQTSCAPCRLPMSRSSLLTGKPARSRRARRARWPPAPANAATPTDSTAARTSNGCATPSHVTRTWMKPAGGQSSRRSVAAARLGITQ